MAQQPPVGQGFLIIEASQSHSDTPHSVRLLWRVINPTQRPLPDNTEHSQETNIYAPGGIRTHNPSKRAAAVSRLRPRGRWDRYQPHKTCDSSMSCYVFFYLFLAQLIQSLIKTEYEIIIHKEKGKLAHLLVVLNSLPSFNQSRVQFLSWGIQSRE
jgi:hypothetical protein